MKKYQLPLREMKNTIITKIKKFLTRIQWKKTNIHSLPISAFNGNNIKDVDENMLSIDLTSDKLKTEMDRLQGEFDAQEYARNRASAFPSMGDQLDMIMKDTRDDTTTHQEACEAVKAKYPKPE